MLYDHRHHVDVALQGNLLISVIPPTPHRANMELIYYLFTDRCVRLFQPLAFIDPKANGMGASGNLDIEGSNVAIPEGQHKRFTTVSGQRPLKSLRPQLSTRTTSKRDVLLMPRKFQSPMFRLET